jgi:imidazole glycerol-phosphate synthase subunit HisH
VTAGPLIAVLDYGIGNLRSAEKSLQHVGADARLTADRALVADAHGVVLPGVGAFGACMAALGRTGLDQVAIDAAASGRPFLGICIGMQLLFDSSDESPGQRGLGVLAGAVRRLPPGVKRPQMQWNRLHVERPEHPLLAGLDGSWMYFVHSFAADLDEPGDLLATVDYGGPVVAAAARANVWSAQFHPEKSARSGLALLANFAAAAGAGAPPARAAGGGAERRP